MPAPRIVFFVLVVPFKDFMSDWQRKSEQTG
jgi:hypothetical protein